MSIQTLKMLTLLVAAITAIIYIEGTGYLKKLYISGELFDWRTSKWIIFLVLVLAGILPAAAAASSPLPLFFIPVGIIFLRRMKQRRVSGQTKVFLLLEALFTAFMFSSNISGLLDGGIDILSGFSWNDILTAASAGWDYNAAYTYLHGGNASETAAAMNSWDFVPAVRLVFIRLVVLALAVIACAAAGIHKFFLKKADGMHGRSASPETGVPAQEERTVRTAGGGVSVTGRIREVKQPRGGYVKPSQLTAVKLDDGKHLRAKKDLLEIVHQVFFISISRPIRQAASSPSGA